MYLKMAETEQSEKRIKYYHSIEEQLNNTLNNIRNLSYKITPLANQLLDTEDMITEYIKRVEPTFPFKINLSLPDISNSTDPDVLLTIVRMIELWLKVLHQQKKVTAVNINVTLKHQLDIQITDNGDIINHAVVKKQVLEHILCDKIYLYGGSITISDNKMGNILKITLPVHQHGYPDKQPAV